MATLEQLGVTTERQFQTDNSSLNLGGLELSNASKKTTKLTLTLPTATPIKAEFCSEGLAKKLIKIFKKELQTGDQSFDDAVYITTETPEATTRFLESPEVRALVAALVATGPLEINSNTVTAVTPNHVHDEDEDVNRLVAALLR